MNRPNSLNSTKNIFLRMVFYMKKIICLLVTFFMIGLCPLAAMAQNTDTSTGTTVNLLDNAVIVSADGTVKPVPFMDLGGGSELQPGDKLICSPSIYLSRTKTVVFNASCSYGDVAKLEIYYGGQEGDTDNYLGDFKATQGKWYGELSKSMSAGTWYFVVKNGGSHNIMVDSVTVNF